MSWTQTGRIVKRQFFNDRGVVTGGITMEWCRCDCGVEKWVRIVAGKPHNSIGCRACFAKRKKTHGHCPGGKGSPTYKSWMAMRERSRRPNNPCYQRYRELGLNVCDRWQNSFEAFFADMGERPAGKSLDRIDNNSGYDCGKCDDCRSRGVTKCNCRWADAYVQQSNRSDSVFVTVDGQTLTVSQWARKKNVHKTVLFSRIRRGWDPVTAVTTEPRRKKRRVKHL